MSERGEEIAQKTYLLEDYIIQAENTICDIYYKGFENGINSCLDILGKYYGEDIIINSVIKAIEDDFVKKRDE